MPSSTASSHVSPDRRGVSSARSAANLTSNSAGNEKPLVVGSVVIPHGFPDSKPPDSVKDAAAAARAAEVEAALQQSAGMFRSPRMYEGDGADAVAGHVRWKPAKSLWIGGMTFAALIGGPFTATPGALILFVTTTAVTICLGHSIGMHRRLIHRAFDCPLWLEHLFVYLGTLVGMAGPLGMIRQHDIRDWAQRKADCHPYLAHRNPLWRDGFWQLHCELSLDRPPHLELETGVANDTFYRFLERTWMAQQVPWALLFYWLGGMPWMVWGICARVALSVTGHWLVGYFAHNEGPRNWHVEGAGVQGYNVPIAGLVTFGEAWHNNHHAFPASAKLGLRDGETDLGWLVLKSLAALDLVSNLKTPADLPARTNLVTLNGDQVEPMPVTKHLFQWVGCDLHSSVKTAKASPPPRCKPAR